MVSTKSQVVEKAASSPKKRKEPPSAESTQTQQNRNQFRNPKRTRLQDARTVLTQTSEVALSRGSLNLDSFLRAREFEIKALEDGMKKAKGVLSARAFQQVPREMRRRTASHNVKRVPKRLRNRATREMREDNTPTVTADKRIPRTTRGRLRTETAKRLGVLAAQEAIQVKEVKDAAEKKGTSKVVKGRLPIPKQKRDAMGAPPKPVARFRKRQIHKTWLPTHMYHTKRAKMTAPQSPLWRFAVPLTPTEKSYRPTHRSSGERGTMCWDMSYMSTIGLEGNEQCLEKVLRAVGVKQETIGTTKGQKWTEGKRSWNGWVGKTEAGSYTLIGPATVIWCSPEQLLPDGSAKDDVQNTKKARKLPPRKCIVRVHPSAFLELWNELLRMSKQQRPVVHIEDLRFEIGGIDLTGPGATEALCGILHPFDKPGNSIDGAHADMFTRLLGLTNAATLPPNAILTFRTLDPRLRHPPRKARIAASYDAEASAELLQSISSWPPDQSLPSRALFDRETRFKASHLPSQKSINRRKGAAPPGAFPPQLPSDPAIPILLHTSRIAPSSSAQGTYTLLAPWKCILPFWYSLMFIPLTSGGNPRFGGLDEIRQVHFEHDKPWFPGDYPGTDAGWKWEMEERETRKKAWDGRPKGKRVEWGSLDLGGGRKGEIGIGWSNDWEWFLNFKTGGNLENEDDKSKKNDKRGKAQEQDEASTQPEPEHNAVDAPLRSPIQHLPMPMFKSLLSGSSTEIPRASVATICITLFSRGVPQPCARIYRLPSSKSAVVTTISGTGSEKTRDNIADTQNASANDSFSPNPPRPALATVPSDLRAQWLALDPLQSITAPKSQKTSTPKSKSIDPSLKSAADRRRSLAQSFITTNPLPLENEVGADNESRKQHLMVPGEEDLIGFVTTGGFNLAAGKGTAMGGVWVERILDAVDGKCNNGHMQGIKREGRICIVRNAGEAVGRLGIWEAV